jgi:hypothetical protein
VDAFADAGATKLLDDPGSGGEVERGGLTGVEERYPRGCHLHDKGPKQGKGEVVV